MFDATTEHERALVLLKDLLDVGAPDYDPSDPHSSFTLGTMYNYLLGIWHTLRAANEDIALEYPEEAIRGLIQIQQTKPKGQKFSLNIPEEEERARAFYALQEDLVKEVFYGDDIPEVARHALGSAMGVGVLIGIINALAAVQGKTTLDYDMLIPNEPPEGL